MPVIRQEQPNTFITGSDEEFVKFLNVFDKKFDPTLEKKYADETLREMVGHTT